MYTVIVTFVISLFWVEIAAKDCKKSFYMYTEGPWASVVDVVTSARDPLEIMEASQNRGAGKIINETMGIYHTDQYHLFSLIWNR